MGGLTGSAGTPPQYTGMTMPQANATMTDAGADGGYLGMPGAPAMSTGPAQMPSFQMTPAGRPATSGAATLGKYAANFGKVANAMQPFMQAVVPGYQGPAGPGGAQTPGQGYGRTQGYGQGPPQPVPFQTGQPPNVTAPAPLDLSMYYPRNPPGGY